MKKPETRRETKLVVDFVNADFAHKTGKREKWAKYLVDDGLGLKQARAIQETVLAAHRSGNVAPLADGVREYADRVQWTPSKDGRKFEMLRDISRPEAILYVSLVKV